MWASNTAASSSLKFCAALTLIFCNSSVVLTKASLYKLISASTSEIVAFTTVNSGSINLNAFAIAIPFDAAIPLIFTMLPLSFSLDIYLIIITYVTGYTINFYM